MISHSIQFFKQKVENVLLESNSETLLINYLKWNANNYLDSNFKLPKYLSRRNVNRERLIILGGSKHTKTLHIEYYSTLKKFWQVLLPAIDNFDHTYFAATEFNDLVILAGGLLNGSPTNIVSFNEQEHTKVLLFFLIFMGYR